MKFQILISFTLITIFARAQQTDDTTAIKNLLQKESATWRAGDVKGHADCWFIEPYSRVLVSTPDGSFIDVPPANMINPPAGSMGKGGSAVQTNLKISIHGNDGWVSHDEISTRADGTKSYSSEFRMLEKINGEWKIVAQSIHAYKPK
jgi:hypothetical protein